MSKGTPYARALLDTELRPGAKQTPPVAPLEASKSRLNMLVMCVRTPAVSGGSTPEETSGAI
eukprot:CAMPEP_0175907512 /NCGR_PEP_ID=MMETSP0108-20121206/6104_1 /TAXON_ID=195067 ORGANISM="Goniomonas pacifica, Strain CCMP1869" /NCGR_SAMPLE_ID=MMETSP0108 /ASSEMBLY_ACC=CAM_ASM_000204 /LENGTH=61 /DNA_ID=CAMNT_0017229505 /DNA_START=888 /DNA_END=1076 /DNA_ORIENTATION=-